MILFSSRVLGQLIDEGHRRLLSFFSVHSPGRGGSPEPFLPFPSSPPSMNRRRGSLPSSIGRCQRAAANRVTPFFFPLRALRRIAMQPLSPFSFLSLIEYGAGIPFSFAPGSHSDSGSLCFLVASTLNREKTSIAFFLSFFLPHSSQWNQDYRLSALPPRAGSARVVRNCAFPSPLFPFTSGASRSKRLFTLVFRQKLRPNRPFFRVLEMWTRQVIVPSSTIVECSPVLSFPCLPKKAGHHFSAKA